MNHHPRHRHGREHDLLPSNLFRDCVATFIAEQAPGEGKIIVRILGHATLATAEEHYNHAGMLSAQARYLEALARLRGQADHPSQQPST